MTTAAKTSFGAKLFVAPSGVTPLVNVAELLSLNPPVPERATQDVTTHDSAGGAMEFIPEGVYDSGEVSGQVHYIADSAFDTTMITAYTTGGLYNFKTVSKGASGLKHKLFSGYVTSYGPDGMEVTGKQTASFSIKVTGAITEGDEV